MSDAIRDLPGVTIAEGTTQGRQRHARLLDGRSNASTPSPTSVFILRFQQPFDGSTTALYDAGLVPQQRRMQAEQNTALSRR